MVHRGQTAQSQVSRIRISIEGKTEHGLDQTLFDHRGDDRVVFDLRRVGICRSVGPLICTREQRVGKSHKAACHIITGPVSTSCQHKCLGVQTKLLWSLIALRRATCASDGTLIYLRVVDKGNFLVLHGDSGNGDVLVSQNPGQELAIAVLDVEVLIRDRALVEGATKRRSEVAIGFL